MSPFLARIRIFPVKSLDPVELDESIVLRNAGLAHDREFCLTDEAGDVLNTKRLGAPLIGIRSEFDLAFGEVTLHRNGAASRFRLPGEGAKMESWLTQALDQPVRLDHDPARGFPDDLDAPGPTLISTATLEEIARWFPGLDADEVRRRFRANLEIGGVPAFWEDRLFGPAGSAVRFRIGDVALEGLNPSARCTVPSLDSKTGAAPDPGFAKTFAERRRQTLPPWAEPSRFDHFYRVSVNTRIPESENGKSLHVSDEVVIEDGPETADS